MKTEEYLAPGAILGERCKDESFPVNVPRVMLAAGDPCVGLCCRVYARTKPFSGPPAAKLQGPRVVSLSYSFPLYFSEGVS